MEVENQNAEEGENEDEIHRSSSDSDTSTSSDSSDSEDSSSEDEFNHNSKFVFMPDKLFNSASHTTGEAISLLMDLYSKHAITKSCMKDLVQLIHRLLPAGNTFPRSFHLLKKHLKPFIPSKSVVVHYVCEKCLSYLGNDEVNQCRLCPNSKKIKYYELPVSLQIKYLFEKRNLADAMDNFRGHSKAGDITNGNEYIRLKNVLQGTI